jgi:hypothetical protein
MDGGGRRSPRLTAAGEASVERVQKRNSRSVSPPPPPAQTGVKARSRREPVQSGKGAQGTKVGPVLAKADRDRAAGVEEELVDLGPAWSAEEDEEEGNAGAEPAPEAPLPAATGRVLPVPSTDEN